MSKPLGTPAPAVNIPPPLPSGVSLSAGAALARARQIAMSIGSAGADESDISKMHFNADFEINDYPPQVFNSSLYICFFVISCVLIYVFIFRFDGK